MSAERTPALGRRRFIVIAARTATLALFGSPAFAADAAAPASNLIQNLQQRFSLNEGQVRGALGALLVYARERLPQTEFDELAAQVPNAERIMQDVKLQGIVTRPLDNLDEYEEALSSLGIGQPLASQIAPAVLEYLGAAGRHQERDILSRIL
jgi:uncharacterized protein VcgC/VcgE DUF2780